MCTHTSCSCCQALLIWPLLSTQIPTISHQTVPVPPDTILQPPAWPITFANHMVVFPALLLQECSAGLRIPYKCTDTATPGSAQAVLCLPFQPHLSSPPCASMPQVSLNYLEFFGFIEQFHTLQVSHTSASVRPALTVFQHSAQVTLWGTFSCFCGAFKCPTHVFL